MTFWNILRVFFLLPCCCTAALNFLHIPKTAGTTLMSLLDKNFKDSDFYPFKDLGHGKNSIEQREFLSQQEMTDILGQYPLITQKFCRGHFPFWFLQQNDPDFDSSFTFTVLREPVSRVISQYYFKVGLEEEIDSPLEVCPNLMCRMLCSDCTLRGEELLEDCKKNLEQIDFIIFLDDFDGCISRLFRKLGLKNTGSIPAKNRSEKTRRITPEEKQGIRDLNSLDIRLYEYAITYLRYKSY